MQQKYCDHGRSTPLLTITWPTCRARSSCAGSLSQQLVTLMAAQVGLDPVNDVHWITDPKVKPLDLFAEGKIDAFLAYPLSRGTHRPFPPQTARSAWGMHL